MADEASGQAVARENEDEDSGLSMLDVLEGENQLEEDAVAVLGDSDDKNCTYLMVNSNYESLIGLRSSKASRVFFFGVRKLLGMTFKYLILWVWVKG